MSQLGKYILDDSPAWKAIKQRASVRNAWFIPEFIDEASERIARDFLDRHKLENWVFNYKLADSPAKSRNIGIVMAGNIPLVGFHDFLCSFISGHDSSIKLSSKDDTLLPFLVEKMQEWEPALKQNIRFASLLKGADAYIATGSDNTARYFEYYFSRHHSIIRHNRTSIAILDGRETFSELEKLADDVHLYFGLGCRNVTKIYVPRDYDFVDLLKAFEKYSYFKDHNKFRNNYDYNLTLQIMNRGYYMTNGTIILVESNQLFSPISQLNYQYLAHNGLSAEAVEPEKVQCIIGHNHLPFGSSQKLLLDDYADGVDTLQFLQEI